MTHSTTKLRRIHALLPKAMAREREAVRRALAALGRPGAKAPGAEALQRLEARLSASRAEKDQRRQDLPALAFPEALPITARRAEIVAAIRRHRVLIVSGETGSGKSTQIPKFCLEAGRGIGGLIGHTQPRRIAAVSVAQRLAEELGSPLGEAVGFKVRFSDRTSRRGYIKLMTDGILLAEVQSDRELVNYDTIIVDEAHERSLNIDFILGYLRRLLDRRRDLKVVVTSATIDTEKFSQAFGGAPVIDVTGRAHPVEVRYRDPAAGGSDSAELTHVEAAVQAVAGIEAEGPWGDILVFMPTEQDIRETCELLEGRGRSNALVLPLFARLTAAEQSRVFSASNRRRIIVATNVAETSITIPGIRYVVDTGLARIARYSPRTRTSALPVAPISRSSADQRKGRSGRTAAGVCIRLYSEEDFQGRPQFTPPEILRANLAEVILRMVALGLGDIAEFPFIDRPDPRSIRDGFHLLLELGAIEESRRTAAEGGSELPEPVPRGRAACAGAPPRARPGVRLTAIGRQMARMPLDPRLARMLIAALAEKCAAPVAVIAAALSVQDPRERPVEKAAEADRAHAAFRRPGSDFLAHLGLWARFQELRRAGSGANALKRFCRENFLSYRRMREWEDIHRQILEILAESGPRSAQGTAWPAAFRVPESDFPASEFESIHRAVLAGFLSNIAVRKEKNIYRAARGREAMIHPGSGLFGAAGEWIVAAELIETSRLFARTAARVEAAWIEAAGAGLCRSTYANPRWDARREQVVASEQVSLFGLILVPERTVAYGRVNPEEASEVFIREALVAGEIRRPPAFLRHNQALAERVLGYEERLRRRDLLAAPEAQAAFYSKRLEGVFDPRSLAALIQRRGGDEFLRMTEADLLRGRADPQELALYPERVAVGKGLFDCRYRYDPGREEDGATLEVPAAAAGALAAGELDWLVPGLLRERVEALLRGLPKDIRRRLAPLKDSARLIVDEMPRRKEALIPALADFLARRFGVRVPASAWREGEVPEHLRLRLAITAPDGRVLAAGRDPSILSRDAPAGGIPADVRARWEKAGLKTWDFGALPEALQSPPGDRVLWAAFPALAPGEKGVDLKLFPRRDQALRTHREGVAALFKIKLAGEMRSLKRSLAIPDEVHAAAALLGGARALESAAAERVVRDLFAVDIRTPEAFERHAAALSGRIVPEARELLYALIPVFEAHAAARRELAAFAGARGPAAEFRQGAEEELNRLLPPNFIALYARARLPDLVRYLKAFGLRLSRAAVDLEKDRAKADRVSPYGQALKRRLAALSADSTDAERLALEELFWMIEEYKVSVFAPEIGTPVRVSPKRLAQKIAEIEGRRP
jgi:ATP-dependent helicase HrpA